MAPRYRPGGCCGCGGACTCCAGKMLSLTVTPTIYKPFVGPITSRNSGTSWFTPSSDPSQGTYAFRSGNIHRVLECTNILNPASIGVYTANYLTGVNGYDPSYYARDLGITPLINTAQVLTPSVAAPWCIWYLGINQNPPYRVIPNDIIPRRYLGLLAPWGDSAVPHAICVSPNPYEGAVCNRQTIYSSECGSTLFTAADPFSGLSTTGISPYTPTTRQAATGVAWYETRIYMVAWLGTSSTWSYIYNPDGGDANSCRVHLAIATGTKYHTGEDFVNNTYFITSNYIYTPQTYDAISYWMSEPLPTSGNCNDTSPTVLRRIYSSQYDGMWQYNASNGYAWKIWRHGATIAAFDSTIPVTITWG